MNERLEVYINDETAASFRHIALREGLSYTEVVRRSARALKLLDDAFTAGSSLWIEERNGSATRIHSDWSKADPSH